MWGTLFIDSQPLIHLSKYTFRMDPYEHTELPEMVQIAIFPRLSDNILLESQTTSVLKMKVNGN